MSTKVKHKHSTSFNKPINYHHYSQGTVNNRVKRPEPGCLSAGAEGNIAILRTETGIFGCIVLNSF